LLILRHAPAQRLCHRVNLVIVRTVDRLGPYEILAPIGKGGMGEVYRARDTKLEREVAIKVLPTALALDPERLTRFEREAKVLASLNHPNIATIYGVMTKASSIEI
jgi:serine/threonine-protein kinase